MMKMNSKIRQVLAFPIVTFILVGTVLLAERSVFGFGDTKLSFEYFLRLDRGGKVENTTEIQEFFKGDRLRFVFKPAQDCYAYIILKGSSGRYQVLFPSRDIDGGRNWITEDKEYTVPGKGDFIIDHPSGIEHVFFFFSPAKISEIEAFVTRGFAGANIVEDTILNLRNRQADEFTWTLEKEKDKCTVSLKSPEKSPILVHDFFIRHR